MSRALVEVVAATTVKRSKTTLDNDVMVLNVLKSRMNEHMYIQYCHCMHHAHAFSSSLIWRHHARVMQEEKKTLEQSQDSI